MKRVLLVEDELPIATLLQAYLEKENYEVMWNSGEGEIDVMEQFLNWKPDLVLLDLMLPNDQNGIDILHQIRQLGSCPVIILTARGAVPERLQGFDQGADDYIAKPFDPQEVMARIQAVLRRSVYMIDSNIIRLGSLVIDASTRSVTVGAEQISLLPRDYQLLTFLAEHPHQCFERDQLLNQVWGIDFEGGDRSVDTSIKRLRKSLQYWPAIEGEIETIRGMGYSIRVY
ncbi:response regulator transcription factor [Paenibacillus antarcticus]|uniref:DNA-binding response regulator n=1 Tax=Paenibacillus antarcticus TaxID=253703 RepID=A0A168LKR1_9BACL|nr:response regulator transcription factor [Paenibacillus antarcticus]OAB43522.1 DNA-binding response regulator [Paenibacillus antarcticus]